MALGKGHGFAFLLLYLFSFPFHAAAAFLGGLRRHLEVNETGACDIFKGNWVRADDDSSYPLYQSSSCPLIDPKFNCQHYGRPDSSYQRYKWKPNGCDLPRFDGVGFLTRMKGKTVMFVGDSMGQDQWESLICLLTAAAPQSPTQRVGGDPLSTFKFSEYGVSISFYRAPYLVDIDVARGRRILSLGSISADGGNAWRGADVLSFNTGHWWTHIGSLQGWDYMEEGGSYHEDMDRLVALQKGLTTWAKWADDNIDRTKTSLFFQSISPDHYNSAEWSDPASRNCYGETAPVTGRSYAGPYPEQMKVVLGVIGAMKNPPYLLDITTLSQLRKDAHPSVYSGELSPEQRADPDSHSDCSHWCLPGLPDTWNQLLYTALFYRTSPLHFQTGSSSAPLPCAGHLLFSFFFIFFFEKNL